MKQPGFENTKKPVHSLIGTVYWALTCAKHLGSLALFLIRSSQQLSEGRLKHYSQLTIEENETQKY